MTLKELIYKVLGRNTYRTIAHDDFILRLRSSVIGEGMLHPGNVYLMDQAIRQMPSGGVVLEVGSYAGLSSVLLRYLLDRAGRNVDIFCCDAWIYEGYHDQAGKSSDTIDGRLDVRRADFTAYIKQAFIQSNQLLSRHRLPYAFHLESDTFFDLWHQGQSATDVFGRNVTLGGAISFAYIDGNHAYDYARRDVENAALHLLPGGYLLLDDSAEHQRFGSAQLAKELCQHPLFETVLANPHFLFRKKC